MSPQDFLWSLPTSLGVGWWLMCSALAIPAAGVMLIKLVVNEPFNMLTLTRAVIVCSFVAFGLVPLNSGWLPWGVLLASLGGLMASLLLAVSWCHRPDKLAWLQSILKRTRDVVRPRA